MYRLQFVLRYFDVCDLWQYILECGINVTVYFFFLGGGQIFADALRSSSIRDSVDAAFSL